MHRKYAAKGLVTISLCLDEASERADAEKFLIAKKAEITNFWLDEPRAVWAKKFGIEFLPCVFVYDRRGKWIAFKTEGANDVDYAEGEKTIVKLLAE
jgi:hypothetical protein